KIERLRADADLPLDHESGGPEQRAIVFQSVAGPHVPAALAGIERLGAMPRMLAIRATEVQHAARAKYPEELADHVGVATHVLEHFKAYDLVERSIFAFQIVEVALLEAQAPGIGFAIA